MASSDDRRLRAISALGTIDQAEAEIEGWHRSALVYSGLFPLFSLLEILDYIRLPIGPMSSTTKPDFLHPRNKWMYYPLVFMVALGPPFLIVVGLLSVLLDFGVFGSVSWKTVLWGGLAIEVGLSLSTALLRHHIWEIRFQPDSGAWLELERVIAELSLDDTILPSMSSGVTVAEVAESLVQLRRVLHDVSEAN